MSTSQTTDRGDYTETVAGEPTWENPRQWYSVTRTYKTGTQPDNERDLREKARQALDTNRTYVALTSPTAAQTTAQVKALSRQMNGLIRLVLGQLDGTD